MILIRFCSNISAIYDSDWIFELNSNMLVA
jgi:hypothetical protein